MPTTYKGLTIPVSSDLADGPTAFASYTDTLPFQVFADVASRNAWVNPPNGAMCVTANDWHRWVYRSNVWIDVTLNYASKGLTVATNISTTAISVGTQVIAAVPYARRIEMSAQTLVSSGTASLYDLNVNCAGGGASATCYGRGYGNGTVIVASPFQFTLAANAAGDVTVTIKRASGTDAGADSSGDGRYAYLSIKYWGI